MNKCLTSSAVAFAFGVMLTLFISSNFECGDNEKTEVTSSYYHKSTETKETVEGKPDTTSEKKKQRISVKWQMESFDVLHDENLNNQNDRFSLFDKRIKFDSLDAELALEIKTYPAVDSVDVGAELDLVTKTITRIDTVKVTKTDSVLSQQTIYVKELPQWTLNAGIKSHYQNQLKIFKHISLSYNKDIGFGYLSVSGGFENPVNEGFNGIKPAAKLEWKLPL